MTIYQTSSLSKPAQGTKVPEGTLGYVRAKFRNDLYDLILRAFVESGISQVEVARRLGKDPATVNRNIGAPGNWTLETASDMLFAISGHFISVSDVDELSATGNQPSEPSWLDEHSSSSLKGFHSDSISETISTKTFTSRTDVIQLHRLKAA